MSQPVTAELRVFLEGINQLIRQRELAGEEMTVELARAGLNSLAQFSLPCQSLARVEDRLLYLSDREIPLRIYDPAPDRRLPVVVFCHGGGHMCGSVALYDGICRRLAQTCQRLVVAVDYCLSPEFPYPAGLEDCMAVVEHLQEILEGRAWQRDALCLAGDSGGGTLATTVAYRCRQQGSAGVARLLLIYPSLDYTMSSASMRVLGRGYLLERSKIGWYFDHYLQHGEDRRALSPLFFQEPECLPATLIMAAGLDPLVDEGRGFQQRLQRAGVHCERHVEEGLIHCFLNLEQLLPARMPGIYARMAHFLGQPHVRAG